MARNKHEENLARLKGEVFTVVPGLTEEAWESIQEAVTDFSDEEFERRTAFNEREAGTYPA